MYKLSVYNNGVETVVHYPSANQEDPHISKLALKEGLSAVDTLSFDVYTNNPAYNKVFELTTRVKVIDVRDNTVKFTGRIFNIDESMDNSGNVKKQVTTEGALSYLNDTKLRGTTIYGSNATNFLSQVLAIHNAKVDSSKRIQIGIVDIPGTIYHTCEYKSTLAELLLVREENGGNIRVRETNGILYLDWLLSFTSKTLEVSLGINMKDMIVSKDLTSIGTRIIPLGANNLTIETVNNGLDYIDDATAKSLYGVIEKTVEYRDVKDALTLYNTCISDISNHTQPSYTLKSNALDLSYLTNNKAEQFILGAKLHLLNVMMGVDAIYSIVEIDLDLLQPYDPTLTISKKPETFIDTINDLRRTTIQNEGVYNNVQIGRSFGIRAVRSDGKAVTTMNATEGIKVQTNRGSGLVDSFYVDTNGNLKINTYDEITGALTSSFNVANAKISAVVQTNDGGATYELNNQAFKVAFLKAGSGYTEIKEDGITIYDGKFKIKNNSDIVFYVNDDGRCAADGGFIVDDGSASTSMDSSGLHITNVDGQTADLSVTDIGRFFTPGSMEIDEGLDVNGFLHANGTVYMYGSVHVWDNDGYGDIHVDQDVNADHDVNAGHDVNVSNNIVTDGTIYSTDLDVSGSKNCLQTTVNYGHRRLNALETCEYYFGDRGFAIAKEDTVIIMFDDIFLECVNTNVDYNVQTQIYNNKQPITYIERFPTYCIIHCEVGTEFSWAIDAKRIGYENIRLQQKIFDDDYDVDSINFNRDLNSTININDYYADISSVDNSYIERSLLEVDTETEKYLMEVI